LISLIPFSGVNINVRGQIAELDNMTSSDNSINLISVEKEDKCSTKIGSAGMGFPRADRTECELEEWNDCKDLRQQEMVRLGELDVITLTNYSWMRIVSIDQLSRKLYVPG
jgi:hypothetical protein